MAHKTAKPRGKQARKPPTQRRRSSRATSARARPTPTIGIEGIDATENEPGMPEAIDVAETARERWELDPASAEDYAERIVEEKKPERRRRPR